LPQTYKRWLLELDFVRTYLPKDTLDGKHKNVEVAFSYQVGACLNTGLNNSLQINQDFEIYPNPASNSIQIKTARNIEKIEIWNLSGKLLFTGKNKRIDLNDFEKGIYLIGLKTDLGTTTKKFVLTGE
jgi:hypothetical protein